MCTAMSGDNSADGFSTRSPANQTMKNAATAQMVQSLIGPDEVAPM